MKQRDSQLVEFATFYSPANQRRAVEPRIVADARTAVLYVTISLLRGSRQFPGAITPRVAR